MKLAEIKARLGLIKIFVDATVWNPNFSWVCAHLEASLAREGELLKALEFYATANAHPELLKIAPRFREPAHEALAAHSKALEELK